MDERESLEAGKRAQKLPPSTQFAITKCLANIPYGSNWGFATLDEIKDRYEELKKDKGMLVRKVSNGCIVEVQPDYLLKSANMVQRGLVQPEHIEAMKKKIAEAYASFDKYLTTAEKKGTANGYVGIYCVNLSTSIAIKGVTYPAFRVNIANAVELLAKHGYSIGIKNVGFVPATSVVGNLQKVFDSMAISPTDTGVFIKIKK